MTDREAINKLNQIQVQVAEVRHFDSMFESIEVAKEALQERIDREKGCRFCGTKLYFKTTQCARPVLAPLTEVQALKDKLLDLTGEVYVEINAVFCPMCGRKLKSAMPGEE